MTKKISELAEKEVLPYMQEGFDIEGATQELARLSKGFDEIFALLDALEQEDIRTGFAHSRDDILLRQVNG